MKSKHVRVARDTSKFFWNEVFWFWHWHWSTSKWLQFGLSHIIQGSFSWDKHFLLVSRYLSLWPWPFLKSFTIGGICVLQINLDCYDYYIKIKGICSLPESNNSDIGFLFFDAYFSPLMNLFYVTGCNVYTYGSDCIHCGNCSGGVQCNHVTGTCPNGCDAGMYGDKCDLGNMRIKFSFNIFLHKVCHI